VQKINIHILKFFTVCLDSENSVFLRNLVNPENHDVNKGLKQNLQLV